MGSETVTPADVLAVFDRQERPGTPLTAPEVAEVIGCARRTAYNKLSALTDEGTLLTKKVGARGRVWWRPAASQETVASPERTTGGDTRTGGSERILRELHDASRRLMQADTRDTVCAVAVEAARRILGLSLSGLWAYDSDREVLEPVEWTDPGAEKYGDPPTFPIEGSIVGQVFREGSFRVYDDVTTEGNVYDPETDVRSELVLPLGGHGVLNASSPEVGAFDAVDVSLGRILAANVETALDRADQLERRRARRRELERQRDELATLNRINALIEDTIGALVGAATRAEIESTVCERLAASELYADASIVERESASGDLVVRTGASGQDRDGDPLAGGDGAAPRPDPVAAAIDERTLQVVPERTGDEHAPGQSRSVPGDGVRACLVAPLAYADTVFGALVVEPSEPGAFSDRERTAFETLGRVVGFGITATNNRRLLLGTTAVELEVALRDGEAWFLSAADRVDGVVSVEGLVPTGDGAVIEYVTVEDAASDAVPAALVDAPAVRDARVLATDDRRWFMECVVRSGEADLGTITEYGASIRTARATDGEGTVAARFPAATSARDAMAVVREAFPTADLVAKRVVDVSDRSVATVRQALADRLTDRQLAVLQAAFLAGYYDTPRGTTARELAGSLDIAPSTLYQHLQAAHRKLLAVTFEDLSTD